MFMHTRGERPKGLARTELLLVAGIAAVSAGLVFGVVQKVRRNAAIELAKKEQMERQTELKNKIREQIKSGEMKLEGLEKLDPAQKEKTIEQVAGLLSGLGSLAGEGRVITKTTVKQK